MGNTENPVATGASDAASTREGGYAPDAPLTLAGSVPSWSLSYTPSREVDSAAAEQPVRQSAHPEPPGDALEGLALSLWDEGRKQEAISVLERQIALQKESHAPDAMPPVRRFRVPVKTGLAAVMLLAIGGALWGGLNPSGVDPDAAVVEDTNQALLAAGAPDGIETGALGPAREDVGPVQAAVTKEPEATPEPIRQIDANDRPEVATKPTEEATRVAAKVSGEADDAPRTGATDAADAEPEPLVFDEPPAEFVEGAEVAAAEGALPVSEARLPKPRPNVSTKEALAMVKQATPKRPVAKRQTPARPTAIARSPGPSPQPEAYAWQPPPVVGPFQNYQPYPGRRIIVVDPQLAQRRAMAEWYINQRRRAIIEQQAAEEYDGDYYGWPPYGY